MYSDRFSEDEELLIRPVFRKKKRKIRAWWEVEI
jgi:hypothetical protein